MPQSIDLRRNPVPDLPDRVELKDVPFFPQDKYQCGPSSLAMVLAHYKPAVTPSEIVPQVYLPGRKGSLQVEMLAAPRRHGMLAYVIPPRLDAVLREVAAGVPVIVLQDYGVWPISVWHYAVVIGYDIPKGLAILRSGNNRRAVMPLPMLEYTWKESKYWAMVVTPPGRAPVSADESTYVSAVVALEKTGSPAVVQEAYKTALQRWPDNTTALIGLANTFYAKGALRQAEATLRGGLHRQPDSVILLNNLAQTLSDLGRNSEALNLIDKAASLGGPFSTAVQETREQILKRARGQGVVSAPKPARKSPKILRSG